MGESEREQHHGMARRGPPSRSPRQGPMQGSMPGSMQGPMPAPPRAAARVLIVEDNALSRRLFREILSHAGYRVDEAGDGATALSRALADMPDLILLDLNLPGLSGLDLVRRLRAEPGFPRLPILALSASGGRRDVRNALAAGCDAHAAKPLSPASLVRLIADHLSRRSLPDRSAM